MKFVFAFATLFSMNAMATSYVNFECKFSDEKAVDQFSLEAKNVLQQDGRFYNTEFDFSLRKAGSETVERFVVTRDGKVEFFEAGPVYDHPTTRLSSTVKGAELVHMNLLIDVPPYHSSQIRFLNGKTFFGSCKSI